MEKKKPDSNFDRLKQSLLEKRLKAESNKNENINVYTNADVDVDTNTNINTDKKENKSVNIDENININNSANNNVNIGTDKNAYNFDDKSVNNNVNKFVIKSNTDEEALVRYTLYLKPNTINKINYYSDQLKLGKSELVRKILEETLDNLEII